MSTFSSDSHSSTSSSDRPPSDVLVIGAGLAGLAATVALVKHGRSVTLVESKPRLGGRAGSFFDPVSKEWVDQCQHVTMGCCTNLDAFCREVGISHLFRRQPQLTFVDRAGRRHRWRPVPLPSPFHLLPAFCSANFLSWPQRLQLALAMLKLVRLRPAPKHHESMLGWLKRVGQPDVLINRFWKMVLTSALNESLDHIDVSYARQVMVQGMLAHRHAGDVYLPACSLEDLYGKPLTDWMTQHRVRLHTGRPVKGLIKHKGRVTGCTLRDGGTLSAKQVILAVSPGWARRLAPFLKISDDLGAVPITSVHCWFDEPVMDAPHLVAVDRHVHWLFRRGSASTSSSDKQQHIQAVISASNHLARLGNDEAFDLIFNDIQALLPRARSAKLLHHRVITEHQATFSVQPGIDAQRPGQATKTAGLTLAGDFTRTGWPATMEGAVRSGFLAAEHVLAQSGRHVSLTRPPLPANPLIAWLSRPRPPAKKSSKRPHAKEAA